MRPPTDFEVIRDPLWNNIRVDAEALAVLDSEQFQRLRYVRQLGHAFLVYPGATHTRFEHALGTYHLARRALGLLGERGEMSDVDAADVVLVRLAALLHDIGHYPFSHALEEAGLPSHEELAVGHLASDGLREVLTRTGIADAEARLVSLITGRSDSPIQGLVSGSLDLDKIEYLTRDARMCGVPYGTVDVDRLLHSITLVDTPTGGKTVAVHEKGVSALESLLFAKYQMYRNVYWHHAVRSATAMFKRLVRAAISRGDLSATWIAHSTDEALMEALRVLPDTVLANRLRHRQLFKRAMDIPASRVPHGAGQWISERPDLVERVEDRIASEHKLPPGSILLDFPRKPEMLSVDLPVRTRSGKIERVDDQSGAEWLGIQRVRAELHAGARRLRVFAAQPTEIDVNSILSWAAMEPSDVDGLIERGTSPLASG